MCHIQRDTGYRYSGQSGIPSGIQRDMGDMGDGYSTTGYSGIHGYSGIQQDTDTAGYNGGYYKNIL